MFNRIKNVNAGSGSAGYLGRLKVRGLLLVAMVTALQNIILQATDRIILGNLIGADAVSGTVLVAPIISMGRVLDTIVSGGAAVLYTRAVGNYDNKKSRDILGMSMVIAVVFGLFMFAASFFGRDIFISMTGADDPVRTYARQYLHFYSFSFLITPLFALLSEIAYIDGDEIRMVFSNIVLIIGNILLSYFLVLSMGVSGASLGSTLGRFLALVVMASHFLGKKYSIEPGLVFEMNDLKEILKVGGVDCFEDLLNLIYTFIINLFIIHFMGDRYLAVFAISSLIYEFMVVGEGISNSMKTMLLSYKGDKNIEAMRGLLRYGSKFSLLTGSIFIIVIWITAPFFPAIYGITGDMIHFTAWACRLTALSSLACIFYWVFLDYYLNIGKYRLQMLGWSLDTLIVRTPLNVIFALSFGALGFWIGEALCTYTCLAVMILVILGRYGKASFPFLMESSEKDSLNLSCMSEPGQIVGTRDRMASFLKEKNVPSRAVNLAMLFFEEMCMTIKERNSGAETINIDVFITCYASDINMVIWCDGNPLDLSDADMIPSDLRTYLVSSLLAGFNERRYQPTAGYNRASFMIPYRRTIREI